MAEATFRHGDPLMVDYTPSAAVDAGDVIVVDDIPYVAHLDIEADRLGALAARGGVYRMTAAVALAAGDKAFWNDTSKKVVAGTGGAGHKHFGYVVPSSSSSADGDLIDVEHTPDGSSSAT